MQLVWAMFAHRLVLHKLQLFRALGGGGTCVLLGFEHELNFQNSANAGFRKAPSAF